MIFLVLLACQEKSVDSEDPGHDLDSSDTQDSVDSVPCTTSTWYSDADQDGYGDVAQPQEACEPDEGWVTNPDDCDDTRPSIHPGAVEYCNSLDDDCDELVDEDAVDRTIWYTDADRDSYGDATTGTSACAPGDTQVADATDCDDTDADIYPGGTEIEGDDLDDDCDGRGDEVRVCQDGSGGFGSIQAAIDAAPVEGAVIEVCPGTYFEALEIADRVLEIVGETGDPDDVVIDASEIGRAIEVMGREAWSSYDFDGLTLIGDPSGAVLVWASGPLTMRHFVIRGTNVGVGASLTDFSTSISTISDCEILENECDEDSFSPIVLFESANTDSTIRRCYVHDNGLNSAGFYRGLYGGALFSNNLVANNVLRADALEISAQSVDNSSAFYNNTIVGNTITAGPVAKFAAIANLAAEHEGYVRLKSNIFCGNIADNLIYYDDVTWGYCTGCDENNDGRCSDAEAIGNCAMPTFDADWVCESAGDACADGWCEAALTSTVNMGVDAEIVADSALPWALPSTSPAVDRGAGDADHDGTRNDPGRHGGPEAFEE